ncbi:MAG TPA: lipoprotein-releasing ABC transporter ATP-binding protein LolD [Gammaproteobacteria bacterium]|nr:lipoprotein-releasing ABC transporter ATP-binding protein LolD [Gammaproteobacteria bacterium]
MNSDIVLECNNLSKTFEDGKNTLNVLNNINMQIKSGAQIAIMGRSGSGKSTLLQLLGGLDNPTHGSININGKNILSMNEAARARFRNKHVGFIYQMHHLLPEFTALENIAMPLLIAGLSGKRALEEAQQLIDAVGLRDRSGHRPAQLSGGERQRIAIARSLATRPDCVLADEPTGNLDAENAELALQLMQKLNREFGTTFIVVTHDPDLAKRLDHTYHLQEGVLR